MIDTLENPSYSHEIIWLSGGYTCWRPIRPDEPPQFQPRYRPMELIPIRRVMHNERGPASYIKKTGAFRFYLDNKLLTLDEWADQVSCDHELAVWYKLHYV